MNGPNCRRKVLILENEQAVRKALFTLLASLGRESASVASGREALARLSREPFDAILLDLRSSDPPPDNGPATIQDIRPSFVGNVLVVTGKVADPETLDLVERRLLPQVPQNRIWQGLRGYLRALFRIAPAPSSSK